MAYLRLRAVPGEPSGGRDPPNSYSWASSCPGQTCKFSAAEGSSLSLLRIHLFMEILCRLLVIRGVPWCGPAVAPTRQAQVHLIVAGALLVGGLAVLGYGAL